MHKSLILLKTLIVGGSDVLTNNGVLNSSRRRRAPLRLGGGLFQHSSGSALGNGAADDNGAAVPGASRRKIGSSLWVQGLVLLALGIYFAVIFFNTFCEAYLHGQANASFLTVAWGLPITGILFGIQAMIPTFFYAKDLEQLLPLPLPAKTLIQAKYWQALFYGLFMILPILWPVLIAMGIATERPLLYYPLAILGSIMAIGAPLVIVLILYMFLVYYTKLGRNRERFQMVATILMFVSLMVIVIGMQNYDHSPFGMVNPATTGTAVPQAPLQLTTASYILPTVALSALLLSGTTLTALGAFLGLTAIFVLLMLILNALAQRYYIAAIQRIQGTGGFKAARITGKDYRRRGPIRALFVREFKTLYRSPTFFMQLILPVILMPLVIIGMGIYGAVRATMSFGASFSFGQLWQTIVSTRPQIQQFFYGEMGGMAAFLLVLGTFVLVFFLLSSSAISASAISRQGVNISTLRLSPLSTNQWVLGLVLPGFVMDLLYLPLLGLPLLLIGFLPWPHFLLFCLSYLLAITFIQFFGLFLNLHWFRLDWTNEIQACKNGAAITVAIFAEMGIAIGLGFLAYAFARPILEAGRWGYLAIPLVFLVLGGLTALVTALCFKRAKVFERVDL